MPPRFVYWTILAGGLPTAFRATEREELLPTFKRILEKHPDAEMKYFARGKLWSSPEEARAARDQPPPRESRKRDWRPGGEHKDPRQKFVDAKKDRNLRWRKERHDRKNGPPREKPHGDPPAKRAFTPRPEGGGDRPRWTPRPPQRPPFDREGGSRPPARPPFDRDGGPPRREFKRDSDSRPPKRPPFNREGGSRPPARPPFDRDGGPPRREFKRDNESGPPKRPPYNREGGSRPPARPPFKPKGDWRAKPRPPYRKPDDDEKKGRRRS